MSSGASGSPNEPNLPLNSHCSINRSLPCTLHRSKLVAAAHCLAQLAADAAHDLARPTSPLSRLVQQILDGCSALNSCTDLARWLPQLSAQTTSKLGAAFSLLFGPGRAALDGFLTVASASPQEHAALLSEFAATQLAALTGVLDPTRQPQAAAAVAGSTAKPAVLLPWLGAMSEAVSVALKCPTQGERQAHVRERAMPMQLGVHTYSSVLPPSMACSSTADPPIQLPCPAAYAAVGRYLGQAPGWHSSRCGLAGHNCQCGFAALPSSSGSSSG